MWCFSTVVCLLVFCVTLSTVVCLLVYCMTFVHSCLSIGFLCEVCPQLFVCWFAVWRLSTVVCLLVFGVAFVHSCLLVFCVHSCLSFILSFSGVRVGLMFSFLCGVFPQLFVCWFAVWRLSTVVCLLVFGVAFVHSCLLVFCVHSCLSFILSFSGVRVGLMFSFLCGVCPQFFVCWFSV